MSKDGEKLQERKQIAERWQEYMNDLYAGPLIDQMEEEPNLEEGLTTEEIMSSLIATKNNKSSGPDAIPIELVKAGGECVHGAVTHIIKKTYECGIICSGFVDSEFLAIPKKPSTIKCEEQRTIAITTHTSKVLYRCVQRKIAPILNTAINEMQYGFMPNRGTIEAVAALKTIIISRINKQSNTYLGFIDFRKAFDRVDHTKLIEILRHRGVAEADLRIISELYRNVRF